MSEPPAVPVPAAQKSLHDRFSAFSRGAAAALGTSGAFLWSIGVVLLWLITGPFFHFSDTWQLVINSITSVVTFLMVFLIQHTQNRDSKAIHLKLGELIRAMETARNEFVDLDVLSDEELDRIAEQFAQLRQRAQDAKARKHLAR